MFLLYVLPNTFILIAIPNTAITCITFTITNNRATLLSPPRIFYRFITNLYLEFSTIKGIPIRYQMLRYIILYSVILSLYISPFLSSRSPDLDSFNRNFYYRINTLSDIKLYDILSPFILQ